MSIKNTRVRLKDIVQGRTFYTAHPVYGIDTWICMSKPYKSKLTGSLFCDTKVVLEIFDKIHLDKTSMVDCGIVNGSNNGRRTFRKLKQAQEWMKVHAKDPTFIHNQKKHEEFCEFCYTDDYDDYDRFDD